MDESRADVTSEHFDAAYALQLVLDGNCTGVLLPVPQAAAADNVASCRHLLPPTDENYRPRVKASKAPVTTASAPPLRSRTKTSTPRELPLAAVMKRACHNCVGPLSLLQRSVAEKSRVRVCVRRMNDIRGAIEGYVTAFDKHFNLLMVDAKEYVLSTSHSHNSPSHRYMPQVFVKGDSVVTVSSLS